MKTLVRLLRIRRIEFLPAEIPIVAIPLLLCVVRAPVWALAEGVVVFFLLFHFGDMINCLADRDLDAIYKRELSEAVYGLGLASVRAQIGASAVGALLLTLHLAWALGRPLLVPMVVLGLLLGAAYSVGPVRLKGRGVPGLVCVWLILFVGPMNFLVVLAEGRVDPWILAVSAAYATLQMGVILVNTAEDYPEDIESGVRTTVVALGLHRGIALATWMTGLGAAALLAILLARSGIGSLSWVGRAALGVMTVALIYVVASVRGLGRRIRTEEIDASALLVKQAAKKVPIWIAVGAWSTCLAVLAAFGSPR
jgi:4-hydroxybenzoate polyprenyltransferase